MVAAKCQEAAYSGLLDHLLASPHTYRRLAFFFFATLVAVFFPTVLRRADDLVLFAGFFDFFVVFLADFLVPLQLWQSCLLPS